MAGGYDIGPKLGIDGEAEFRKTIQGINTTIKTLGTEMGVVASQFDKNDRSEKALSAQNEVLTKQFSAQKDKLAELQKGLEAARGKYGENDAATQKWQQTVNQAQAELNKLGRSLEENARDLESTKNGYNDAGQKLDEYGSAVEAADQKQSRFSGGVSALAGATVKAVAAIGAAAAAVGSALVAASVSGAAYADTILTLSSQTSISTDKLQEYQYAAELVDVPVETLTKSLAKNTKSMLSAQQGSKNFKDAYEKLGVSFENTDGTLRDGQTVYWELIDALGKLPNETERDALAMQLLGKSAQDLNPLIEAGSARMEELGQKARESGYVMSGETLTAFGALDDQIQYLKVNAEGAKNAFGTVLLPMLTSLATDGTELLGSFTKGIQEANGDIGKMSEVVADALKQVVGKIAEYLPQMLKAGTTILGAIGDGILSNLPTIISAAVQTGQMLLQGLISALPQIVEGAQQLVVSLADGLAAALPQLLPAAANAITAIVEGLMSSIPQLVGAALNLVQGLADGILAAVPVLLNSVPSLIESLVSNLMSSIPAIIQAGIDLITSLVQDLPAIISTVVAVIPDIIDGIVSALMDNIPAIVQAGVDLLISLIDNLPSILVTIITAVPQIILSIVNGLVGNIDKIIAIGPTVFLALIQNLPTIIVELVKAVPKIIAAFVEAFVGLTGKIVEVGENLVRGIWDGIVGMASWIKEKVTGFFSGVVDSVKGFLGIHSPSTVFASLGEFTVEGFAIGMENSKGKAVKTAEDLSKAIYDAASGWVKDKKALDQLTAQEESDFWEELKTIRGLKTEELIEIDKKLYSAREKASKDSFNNSKRWIDQEKFYERLSAQEEVEAWERVTTRKNLMAAEQAEAEKSLFTARKNLMKEQQAEEKKILDEQEKAFSEYQKNLESRAKSLEGFVGLFDAVEKKNDVSGRQLLQNLRSQVDAFEQWQDDLQKLSDKGVTGALFDELQEMGPKAAEQIHALTSLSEKELQDYADLFAKKGQLAAEQAEKELGGITLPVQFGEIEESSIAKLISGVQTAAGNICTTLSGKNDALQRAGEDAMNGVRAGLELAGRGVVDTARKIADAVVEEMRRALDIHSPSRKMRELVGVPTAQGFAAGFEDGMHGLMDRMRRTAEDVTRDLPHAPAPAAGGVAGPIEARGAVRSAEAAPLPDIVVNLTAEMDGAVMARKTIRYSRSEDQRIGGSLVEVG